MREKKIYLLLTDTGTLLNKLIKSYTGKPYNHVSIAFTAELSEVYSFGRKRPRNPFLGGFVKEDLNSELFNQAKCVIYSLAVTDNQIHKMKSYIQKINVHKEEYRYNFLGLFGVMLKKPIKRKKAFFCSQFVASVLKESNTIDFEKDLSLIEPYELPVHAGFHMVYEGRLGDYANRLTKERDTVPNLLSFHLKLF